MAIWRKIAVAAAAALWLVAAAGAAIAGAEEDVGALADRVNALRDAGKDAEAIPLAERALSMATQKLGPDLEAAIRPLVALGAIEAAAAMANRGDWGKAELFLNRALALREKYPGDGKHPSLGKLLQVLATVYSSEKNYREADGYFRRYFEIAEARIVADKLRPDDPEVSQTLTMEWGGYLVRSRIADLEQRFQHMIALSEQHLGYGHPYTGVLVFQLAAAVDLIQGPIPAAPLYDRFVTIAHKALAEPNMDLGPSVTRETLMGNLNRAADRLTMVGQLSRAKEALDAVRNARAAPVPEPAPQPAATVPDADALAGQAEEMENRGNSAGALPLRKRVAELRQQALAANPKDGRAQAGLIAVCQQLADYYASKDLMNDAEPMAKCVLLVREMQGGKLEIASALDNLGGVHERLGRLGEAEEALKRAIVLLEEVKGADTTDASPLRIRVANLMAKQGRAAEGAQFATANTAATEKLFQRPPGARNALADLDNWDERAQSRYSVMEWRSMQLVHRMAGMLEPIARTWWEGWCLRADCSSTRMIG